MIFDEADFAPLRADKTAEYPIAQLHFPRSNPEPLVLVLKHAGDSNKPYKNAIVKAPALTGEAAEIQGEVLFAKHVIVGWKNFIDKDGKPVPYTADGGAELMSLLRTKAERLDIVRGLRFFAVNAENFRAPIVDAGDLGNE